MATSIQASKWRQFGTTTNSRTQATLIGATLITLIITIATIPLTIDSQKLHQNLSKKIIGHQKTKVASHHHELIAGYKMAPQTTISNNNGNNVTHSSGAIIQASYSDLMLRTFIRTNSMRAYHMDLHSYRPGKEFSGDPKFVDSNSLEHKARCSKHLKQYHQLLKSFNELDPMQATIPYEAMKLADIFGRPEAGTLHGNQFWLGSYSDCFDFKLQDNENNFGKSASIINSQYCLGVAQFPNWNPQHGKTSVKVGLCLPETCTNSMLHNDQELFQMVERMMKYQFGSDLPFRRIQLRQIYCLPHDSSEARQFTQSGKILIAFIGTLTIMCLIATVLDYIDGKMPENLKSVDRNWRRILIESFSVTRNARKLTTLSDCNEKNRLEEANTHGLENSFNKRTFFDVISGLKCLGLTWIIFAHTFLVSPITDQNLIHLDKLTKTYFANVLITAHLMVDTFFALSGLLASYLIFKSGIHKLKLRDWIVATVHRYYRLTPIYLICYWFTKSLGSQLGSGPFWDYGTAPDSPRLNCSNESWWIALLHLSDFKSPKEHCIPFAWFIANGIKFWILTPIFLTIIYKSMKRGYAITIAVILANMILVGKLAMTSNVDMKSVIEFKPESADNMLNNMGEVYTRPYSRIAPYLIGLLAGHIIYLIDTKQIQVNLSKNVKIAIWTWFTLTTIVLTFVIKIADGFKLPDEAIPTTFAISSALLRPLWALCTCWLVFALAMGQASWVSKFLSANYWRLLTKLSFCAYLAQGEVIAQLYLGKIDDQTYVYFDMFSRSIIVTILTIVVSALMVIFIEYPLIGIEELILPRKANKSLGNDKNTNVLERPQLDQDSKTNSQRNISNDGEVKLKSA